MDADEEGGGGGEDAEHGLGQDGDVDVVPGEGEEEGDEGLAGGGEQAVLRRHEQHVVLGDQRREQLQRACDAEHVEQQTKRPRRACHCGFRIQIKH